MSASGNKRPVLRAHRAPRDDGELRFPSPAKRCSVDVAVVVRVDSHHDGLARVAAVIANQGAELGDVTTVRAEDSHAVLRLADHAAGNYRVLMNLADELLAVAADRELARLDEKLFLEVFAATARKR